MKVIVLHHMPHVAVVGKAIAEDDDLAKDRCTLNPKPLDIGMSNRSTERRGACRQPGRNEGKRFEIILVRNGTLSSRIVSGQGTERNLLKGWPWNRTVGKRCALALQRVTGGERHAPSRALRGASLRSFNGPDPSPYAAGGRPKACSRRERWSRPRLFRFPTWERLVPRQSSLCRGALACRRLEDGRFRP